MSKMDVSEIMDAAFDQRAMSSDKIFEAAREVIGVVQKHTRCQDTAKRILEIAKQGFGKGLTDRVPSAYELLRHHRAENPVPGE